MENVTTVVILTRAKEKECKSVEEYLQKGFTVNLVSRINTEAAELVRYVLEKRTA